MKAWREAAWHQRYGVRLDERPVAERPWREVEEYETLTEYTIRHEAEARARPQPSSPPQVR